VPYELTKHLYTVMAYYVSSVETVRRGPDFYAHWFVMLSFFYVSVIEEAVRWSYRERSFRRRPGEVWRWASSWTRWERKAGWGWSRSRASGVECGWWRWCRCTAPDNSRTLWCYAV